MSSHIEKQEQERTRWIALGWFYEHGGRRRGPFSGLEIQRQVATGQVPPDVKAYVGWKRGDEVRYLETDLKYALGADKPPSAQPKPGHSSSSTATLHDQSPDTTREESKNPRKG